MKPLFHSALSLLVFLFGSPAGHAQPGVAEAAEGSEESWFRLDVGDLWAFEDEAGKMSIRILEEIDVAGARALRVGWFMEGQEEPYQAEIWRQEGAEYLVVGRVIAGRTFFFEDPYLFLRQAIEPGDTWTSVLRVAGREIELDFTVGERETIETGEGAVEAIKVTVEGMPQTVERWYAPAIGMVKEITRLTLGGRTSPGNAKVLTRHVDGGAKPEGAEKPRETKDGPAGR